MNRRQVMLTHKGSIFFLTVMMLASLHSRWQGIRLPDVFHFGLIFFSLFVMALTLLSLMPDSPNGNTRE